MRRLGSAQQRRHRAPLLHDEPSEPGRCDERARRAGPPGLEAPHRRRVAVGPLSRRFPLPRARAGSTCDLSGRCYYRNRMGTLRLKVARIGNSRGVRLPAALRRYRIGDTVLDGGAERGILLRPTGPAVGKPRGRRPHARWLRARRIERVGRHGGGSGSPIFLATRGRPRRGNPFPLPAEAPPSQATVKRYEIRWTALDPTQGAEMAKTRPAVIVSLDALNKVLDTVTVCPLTSQLRPELAIASAGAMWRPARRSRRGIRSEP